MKSTIKSLIHKFKKNEVGATAIEYGLIAALISVGSITGAKTVGKTLNASFECTNVVLRTDGFFGDGTKQFHQSCVRYLSRD